MSEETIKNAKLFLVGVGGIGSELLKNLVLEGFRNIHIIDLDTIEVSNLNRQFLFHKDHVGESKSVVGEQAAKLLADGLNIVSHHASVFESKFGVSFIDQFDVVINALDNAKARSHVNRLCIAAKKPLIETGSKGWMGQSFAILPYITECYNCYPKSTEKSYPACTIRNTPSEPIHCIVWAKHLFNQLFGETDEDVSPDLNASEGGKESVSNNKADATPRFTTRQQAEMCQYDFDILFKKLFHDDIVYLISMSHLWTEGRGRKAPNALVYENLESATPSTSKVSAHPDDEVLAPKKVADMFKSSLDELRKRYNAKKRESQENENVVLSWDKDDDAGMDFVSSAANLRMLAFHIKQLSRFDIKSKAGKIVPAIAPANAIVAGFATKLVIQVLLGGWEKMRKSFYVGRCFMGDKRLTVVQPSKPNPACYVCGDSDKRTVYVKLNPSLMLHGDFEDLIVKKALAFVAPDVEIVGRLSMLISSEEGETDPLRTRTLESLNVTDGTSLSVNDDVQQMKMNIAIVADADIDDPKSFVITNAGESKAVVVDKNDDADSGTGSIGDANGNTVVSGSKRNCGSEPVAELNANGSSHKKAKIGD